jgi:hypothetical protein
LLLPRACSTMDKIVDSCALTIYPYSLCRMLAIAAPLMINFSA